MRPLKMFLLILVCCVFVCAQVRIKPKLRSKPKHRSNSKTSKPSKPVIQTDFDELARIFIKEQTELKDRTLDKWFEIATSSRKTFKMSYYFNPSKVSKDGGLIQFWIKQIPDDKNAYWKFYFAEVLKTTMPDNLQPETYRHELALYEADCPARKQRLLREVVYWTTGIIDDNPKRDTVLEVVIPDSVGETFLLKACAVK